MVRKHEGKDGLVGKIKKNNNWVFSYFYICKTSLFLTRLYLKCNFLFVNLLSGLTTYDNCVVANTPEDIFLFDNFQFKKSGEYWYLKRLSVTDSDQKNKTSAYYC